MAITARDRRDLNLIFKTLWAQAGFTYGAMEDGALFGDLIANGLAPLDTLASTDEGEGASLVGIQDADENFTAENVEDALAELFTLIQSGGTMADLLVEAATELTIATGAVTATQSYHILDTEADAGSDDLDTINGVADGQFAIFRIANSGRNVVLKHGTGNLFCFAGMDITLDVVGDLVLGFSTGSTVYLLPMSLATVAGGGLAAWLASTAASKGAAGIGINDTGSLITATTVEAALQELRTLLTAKAATTLTIATGVVTATQSIHNIDTEAAAASDDLDTITASRGLYVFKSVASARNIVLKHNTGNIICPAGDDITLDVLTDAVMVWHDGTTAYVISVALAGGYIQTGAATELTIATGVVTATQSYHKIDTEADAASDDLITINGLVDGQFAIFRLENAARNVVLKSGSDNIVCPGGFDITLDATQDCALIFRLGASNVAMPFNLATLSGGGLGAALNSGATGKGASMVALEDVGTHFGTDNVEAALQDLGAIRIRKISLTIGHADLTDGDGSQTINFGSALPANSRILGNTVRVTTPFSGGGAGVVTVDVGSAGGDQLANNVDVFASGDKSGGGTNPNAFFSGATTLTAKVDADVNVADLDAGSITIDVLYVVLA